MKEDFESLRPYRDEETPATLRALVRQPECVRLLTGFYLPRFLRPLAPILQPAVSALLSLQTARIRDVRGLQSRLEPYVRSMLQKTSDGLSVSGLERLDRRPHLFISNHRDIALDPVLIAYALWHGGHDTMRIGFGDNLMHERTGYVTDLMRLNKGFIIRRIFADRREAVAHRRLLSAYIRRSILQDRQSVWIAQRNGRAKDGDDRTHAGLIRMLSLSGESDLSAAVRSLRITPVSISYEYDPCDAAKARELYLADQQGSYDKSDDEDVLSIGAGIIGWKGRMHAAFGVPLEHEFTDVEEVAQAIDEQILGNYVLFPSNYFACQALDGAWPEGAYGSDGRPFRPEEHRREQDVFRRRIDALPEEHRPYVLRMYANPLRNREQVAAGGPASADALQQPVTRQSAPPPPQETAGEERRPAAS